MLCFPLHGGSIIVLMKWLGWTALAVTIFSAPAWAAGGQERSAGGDLPGFAVLELFTSEGCSSCPPADDAVAKIVSRAVGQAKPVYLLAWHVDYWDYLGWKDPYDSKLATQRQERYAQVLHTQLFTPELVANGVTVASYAGDSAEIDRMLDARLRKPAQAAVSVADPERGTGTVDLMVRISGAPVGSVLGVALTEDGLTQIPNAGENSGRRLVHDGVVRSFRQYPIPSGAGPVEVSAQLPVPAGLDPSSSRVIAIVQNPGTLEISGVGESSLSAPAVTASVAGALVDTAGVPLSGASIQVCSDEICLLGRTDPEGRFQVGNIPPGKYALKFAVSDSSDYIESVNITLKAGENLDLATIRTAASQPATESRQADGIR